VSRSDCNPPDCQSAVELVWRSGKLRPGSYQPCRARRSPNVCTEQERTLSAASSGQVPPAAGARLTAVRQRRRARALSCFFFYLASRRASAALAVLFTKRRGCNGSFKMILTISAAYASKRSPKTGYAIWLANYGTTGRVPSRRSRCRGDVLFRRLCRSGFRLSLANQRQKITYILNAHVSSRVLRARFRRWVQHMLLAAAAVWISPQFAAGHPADLLKLLAEAARALVSNCWVIAASALRLLRQLTPC
jgi:hypothetical protein